MGNLAALHFFIQLPDHNSIEREMPTQPKNKLSIVAADSVPRQVMHTHVGHSCRLHHDMRTDIVLRAQIISTVWRILLGKAMHAIGTRASCGTNMSCDSEHM